MVLGSLAALLILQSRPVWHLSVGDWPHYPLGDGWLLLERVTQREGFAMVIRSSFGPMSFSTCDAKGVDTTVSVIGILKDEFEMDADGGSKMLGPSFTPFSGSELPSLIEANPLLGAALDNCYSSYALSIGEPIIAGGYRIRPWLTEGLRKTRIVDGWFVGRWQDHTTMVDYAVEEGGKSLVTQLGVGRTFVDGPEEASPVVGQWYTREAVHVH
jgi:hypothetical protein